VAGGLQQLHRRGARQHPAALIDERDVLRDGKTKAANLTVLLQVYSYLAFTAARYPASIITLSGLTPPTF
jgi:hypothetical protein